MTSPIVHFEIMGRDGDQLADFYRKVFDWDPAPIEGFSSYYGLDADALGGVGGAVGETTEMPNYLALYLGVDDVAAFLTRIEQSGGEVVVPRQVIPGVVTFAMFRDPAGNLMGLAENTVPENE